MMQIQKIQIISNLICYGPCPFPDEEVEQHLTISATGRVWFTGYNFGTGFDGFVMGRKQQFTIGKEVAGQLFKYISDCYENDEMEVFATDIGRWKLKITDKHGEKYEKTGSMCKGIFVKEIDLTEYVKKIILIDDLAVFGSYYKDEENIDE